MTLPPPTPHHFRTKNFEETDLRGKSFHGTWSHANFRRVITGHSPTLNILRQIFSLFLAFLAGFITAYAGATLGFYFQDGTHNIGFLQLAIGILLILFFIITLRRGLTAALGSLSLFTVFLVVITVALADKEIAGLAALSPLILGGSVAGSVGLATAITLIGSQPQPLALSTLGLIVGSFFGLLDPAPSKMIWLLVLSFPVLSLGIYLGHHALQRDARYIILQSLAIRLCTWHSTSFRESNLTGADFSNAIIRQTDLSNANLTLTCWHNARFEQSNLQGTYLENPKIRHLLTTGIGHQQNFDRLDLRNLNLQNVDLSDASLVGADLSGSDLSGANLQRAKLAQAQLYGTNLTDSNLTGAFIQNWGIAPDTKFDGVKCDYIHMHLPTTADPDPCRKPDNRQETFQDGDFSDFIAPIIRTLDSYQQQNLDPRTLTIVPRTLDLYHSDGIDPSAAAIALQKLIEQHPEAQIEMKAIEGHGNQKVRLQAQVADAADRSQLNTDYFSHYNELKGLANPELQKLVGKLEEKDNWIHTLVNIVMTAVSSEKFYIEKGDLIMSQSKGNVNISGVQGNVSGVAAGGESLAMTGVAIGAISDSVTNSISQLPNSADSAQPGIKELLVQLQAAIEAETTLNEEDKVEALEQLNMLAEAGKQPQDNALQKAGKTAMKVLKGTVSNLPEAAKLADACAKLLPIISKILLF